MICLEPIGIIHSPFKEPKGTPIQATAAKDIEGLVEVYPQYAEGLKDVEGFTHLFLIYQLHLITKTSLLVKPFLGDELHGVFATRAPGRPNFIGLSIVRLIKVEGNKLHIKDVDMIDGTPLLDIKPYVEAFDARDHVRSGWFEQNLHKLETARDDGRFVINSK
jgi:tRNA (adenine37-N6)-methyltransferase